MAYLDTVNRGTLRKLAKSGKLEAKCNYRLTDDYVFDNATNFGKTEWLPVKYGEVNGESTEGFVTLADWHFSGKSGMAYKNRDGNITLSVHGNLSFTLRKIEGIK